MYKWIKWLRSRTRSQLENVSGIAFRASRIIRGSKEQKHQAALDMESGIAETPGDHPGDVQHVLTHRFGCAAGIIPKRDEHAV